MNAPNDIHDLVATLKTKGEAFAIATVVRTVSVTSAKAGAKAIILGDGTITDGWIGGGCARSAVLKAAREAIEDGEPRLVSVQPEDLLDEQGVTPGDIKDGIKYARNMCPSKGSMDIFVEAVRPKPELVIMGASPVAKALSMLARPLGYATTVCASPEDRETFGDVDNFNEGFDLSPSNERRFIVVSTQGRGDEAALQAAISTNADYLSFVGSSKKAASLKEKLLAKGADESAFASLKAPAGLDIKAITPEEIALSILAEIIEHRRTADRGSAENNQSEPERSDATDHEVIVTSAGSHKLSFARIFKSKNTKSENTTKQASREHVFSLMRGPCC